MMSSVTAGGTAAAAVRGGCEGVTHKPHNQC